MDDRRIDAIARSLAERRSRRSAVGLATALAVGAVATPVAEAKKKKRCKTVKCFGQCIPSGAECCFVGGGWCEPGAACCNTGCMPDMATCCTDGSGGFCGYRETCCPPSPSYPEGYCITAGAPAGSTCCQDYICDPGYTCCPPLASDPTGGWCTDLAYEFCCPATTGGGSCSFGDKCCPPIPGYPDGFCFPLADACPSAVQSREVRGLIKPKASRVRAQVTPASIADRNSPSPRN